MINIVESDSWSVTSEFQLRFLSPFLWLSSFIGFSCTYFPFTAGDFQSWQLTSTQHFELGTWTSALISISNLLICGFGCFASWIDKFGTSRVCTRLELRFTSSLGTLLQSRGETFCPGSAANCSMFSVWSRALREICSI